MPVARVVPNYIIRMRDHAFDIVGPFPDADVLAEWARRNQEQSGDDPRWQALFLADPTKLRILRPEEAEAWPEWDVAGKKPVSGSREALPA